MFRRVLGFSITTVDRMSIVRPSSPTPNNRQPLNLDLCQLPVTLGEIAAQLAPPMSRHYDVSGSPIIGVGRVVGGRGRRRSVGFRRGLLVRR